MPKEYRKTIRLSEEMVDFIETQPGDYFASKLEYLIMRYRWELPTLEKELAEINAKIEQKKKVLDDLLSLEDTTCSIALSLADIGSASQKLAARLEDLLAEDLSDE